MKSPLAQNIVLRRKSRGWSQADLAHLVGVHVNTIKSIETDKNEGELATRTAIAQSFGCELWELYKSETRGAAGVTASLSDASAFLAQIASLPRPFQKMIFALAYKDERYLDGLPGQLEKHVQALLKAL